jgi:glycine/D-amino acid oxidase-like deaminating enzyme
VRTVSLVVLGGGIAGAACAWWLARYGARDVVWLERDDAPGSRASARSAAILRTAGDDPVLEEFSLESARFLLAPPADFAPHALVRECGLVLLGRGGAAPAGAWESRAPHQRHARALSARAFARLAPHVVHRGEEAWFYAREGRVDVAELITALARGARTRGVELRLGAHVTALERDGARFRIQLAQGGVLAAEQLVLAAGGWSGPLAAALGSTVALAPTRRHIFVTRAPMHLDAHTPIVWNERERFYTRPERGGLLACACDTSAPALEDTGVDAAVQQRFELQLARNVHGMQPLALQDSWSGTRTFAGDDRFVIGPDPRVPGLVWAAALGGHGITAGVAAGRLAAEHALGHVSQSAFGRTFARAFAPERFASEPCANTSAATH